MMIEECGMMNEERDRALPDDDWVSHGDRRAEHALPNLLRLPFIDILPSESQSQE